MAHIIIHSKVTTKRPVIFIAQSEKSEKSVWQKRKMESKVRFCTKKVEM